MECVNFFSFILLSEQPNLVCILSKCCLDIVLLNIELSCFFVLHDMIVLQLKNHVVTGHRKLLPVLNSVHLQSLFVQRCSLRGLPIGWIYSSVVNRMPTSLLFSLIYKLGLICYLKTTGCSIFINFAAHQAVIQVQVEQVSASQRILVWGLTVPIDWLPRWFSAKFQHTFTSIFITIESTNHVATEECVLKLSLHDAIGPDVPPRGNDLRLLSNLFHLNELRLIFPHLRGVRLAGMAFLPSFTASSVEAGTLLAMVVLSGLHFLLKLLVEWNKEAGSGTVLNGLALALASSRCTFAPLRVSYLIHFLSEVLLGFLA